MHVSVRGRASDLASGKLLSDLAAAGVREIEIPFLSAIGEVHDALAGAGDYRSALRAMDTLANLKLPLAVQIVLVPSTWKTIERTLQLLDDRRVREVRFLPSPAVTTSRRVGPSRPASWLPPPGGSSKRARAISTSPGIRR